MRDSRERWRRFHGCPARGERRRRAERLGSFHRAGAGWTALCGFARRTFELAARRLGRTPTVDATTSAEHPVPRGGRSTRSPTAASLSLPTAFACASASSCCPYKTSRRSTIRLHANAGRHPRCQTSATPPDVPAFRSLLGNGAIWTTDIPTWCSPARAAWRRPS